MVVDAVAEWIFERCTSREDEKSVEVAKFPIDVAKSTSFWSNTCDITIDEMFRCTSQQFCFCQLRSGSTECRA